MRDKLHGYLATRIDLPLREARRRWKSLSRRLRRRRDPYENARLPVASWKQCTSQRAMRLWEPAVADGNVSRGELAILAAFAAECRNGANLFEIGTFDGRTTLNLALNAPIGCTIYTLDLPPDTATAFRLDEGEKQFVDKPSSGARYERYRQSCPVIIGRIRQMFGDSGTFDFSPFENTSSLVFVDGSHAYDYVISDSRAAMAMVHSGGVVLWHDYGIWAGVTEGLNELEHDGRCTLRRICGTSLVYWRKP
ncbi:MAG: class I SAM-dependent methyltransferase [Gemmatimonadota bacterium]